MLAEGLRVALEFSGDVRDFNASRCFSHVRPHSWPYAPGLVLPAILAVRTLPVRFIQFFELACQHEYPFWRETFVAKLVCDCRTGQDGTLEFEYEAECEAKLDAEQPF